MRRTFNFEWGGGGGMGEGGGGSTENVLYILCTHYLPWGHLQTLTWLSCWLGVCKALQFWQNIWQQNCMLTYLDRLRARYPTETDWCGACNAGGELWHLSGRVTVAVWHWPVGPSDSRCMTPVGPSGSRRMTPVGSSDSRYTTLTCRAEWHSLYDICQAEEEVSMRWEITVEGGTVPGLSQRLHSCCHTVRLPGPWACSSRNCGQFWHLADIAARSWWRDAYSKLYTTSFRLCRTECDHCGVTSVSGGADRVAGGQLRGGKRKVLDWKRFSECARLPLTPRTGQFTTSSVPSPALSPFTPSSPVQSLKGPASSILRLFLSSAPHLESFSHRSCVSESHEVAVLGCSS